MWPLDAGRQLEISPSTVTPWKSPSIRCLSCAFSSLTDSGARRGPGTSSWSSSSNGRPSQSEFIHVLRGEVQPLDRMRAPGLLVGLHKHAVQPRIFGRGLESLREPGEEPLNDGVAFDADD